METAGVDGAVTACLVTTSSGSGQGRLGLARRRLVLDHEDRGSARSGWREPLAWGSRNGPRKGPVRPTKRVFIQNSALASVRKGPFSAKRDPRRTSDRVVRSAGQTDEVVGFGRKVASRKALVELYKSLPIDEFGSTELALRCGVTMRRLIELIERRAMIPTRQNKPAAAASRKTPGARSEVRRPTQLARGARGRRKTPGVAVRGFVVALLLRKEPLLNVLIALHPTSRIRTRVAWVCLLPAASGPCCAAAAALPLAQLLAMLAALLASPSRDLSCRTLQQPTPSEAANHHTTMNTIFRAASFLLFASGIASAAVDFVPIAIQGDAGSIQGINAYVECP
ncbi:hypothetical protein THAOC_12188, partial [Thalassiosira oceanica]